jgi:hypothetical protein
MEERCGAWVYNFTCQGHAGSVLAVARPAWQGTALSSIGPSHGSQQLNDMFCLSLVTSLACRVTSKLGLAVFIMVSAKLQPAAAELARTGVALQCGRYKTVPRTDTHQLIASSMDTVS